MGKINTYIKYNIIAVITFIASACNVHQWPELPEKVALHLKLEYDTDMPKQFIEADVLSSEYDNKTKSRAIIPGRNMRYIVNAYPVLDNGKVSEICSNQFIFMRNTSEGYDCGYNIELPPGHYNIMVWSDLVNSNSTDNLYYNADNFNEIYLTGEHAANTDYRDAFRGSNEQRLVADYRVQAPDTLTISMIRPLAKYEFITCDLSEFIEREASIMAEKQSRDNSTRVDINKYKVVFYYSGFMPNAFSIFTDKPVDSSTGVAFDSCLIPINENEASMGFDYVFVNGKNSIITVRIAIYNEEGKQISITEPIDVPLKRSWHTIMRGDFLMSEASGGVYINPEFDGDYNFIIP